MITIIIRPLINSVSGILFAGFLNGSALSQDPVEYLNPYIGSIGHLAVKTTHSVRLSGECANVYLHDFDIHKKICIKIRF